MRYNQLGNTGMFVSELCLGTMTFGAAGENAQWGLIASLDQKGVNDIVAKSQGTANPYNMVRATFDALKRVDSPRSVAARRGLKVSELQARRGETAAAEA
jgi:hypothetical protein